MPSPIKGFSRLSKEEKINWLVKTYLENAEKSGDVLRQYWNVNESVQQLHEEFAENTISNYYMPFGVAPNFLINGKLMALPMVTEESSVIAAASKAAKFWGPRGGFHTKVLGTKKIGQIHLLYSGSEILLREFFLRTKESLYQAVSPLEENMKKRGGGILDIELRNKTDLLEDYYQLQVTFETKDSMGANFINSCLERIAETFKDAYSSRGASASDLEVVMSILSNYVPECLVRAEVFCPVSELTDEGQHSEEFSKKFVTALKIAEVEPYRAVTHNKGIMNGVDAVVLATGNDFRAVEAGVHAYASRTGRYTSLSHAKVIDGNFHFWMEIPISLGTVGGLTSLHPLSKIALQILQKPSASELMQIVAAAGLAQNFAAVHSLVTTGIQKGHMKMHLLNILNQLEASPSEKIEVIAFFKNKQVTHKAVERELLKIRG